MTAAAPGRVVTEAERRLIAYAARCAPGTVNWCPDACPVHSTPDAGIAGPDDLTVGDLRALAAALRAEPQPDGEVERLAASLDDLTRRNGRLQRFVGYVRMWVHRQTPKHAVNPITDEMRLDAIKGHPMLNDTDACLAGLAVEREYADLVTRAEQAERLAEAIQPEAIIRALCDRSRLNPEGQVAHDLRAVLAELSNPAPAAAREIQAAALEEAADLREQARCLDAEAWCRQDGGQELTLRAMELEAEADRLDALKQETDHD